MQRVIGCIFIGIALALLPVIAVADSGGHISAPDTLRVTLIDNYPPYIMRDSDGVLSGYLVDEWRLWESKTGVRVELMAGNPESSIKNMLEGRADVIDTLYRSTFRENMFDFSQPYATLPVSIYTASRLDDIKELSGLDGFQVGVKEGDTCIGELISGGIAQFEVYPDYEALMLAALAQKIHVFCMADLPANFLFFHAQAEQQLSKAFTLYTNVFYRAVSKGSASTLALVEQGFAAITAAEREQLHERWMGRGISHPLPQGLLYTIAIAVVLILLLLAVSLLLRRMVRLRTAALLVSQSKLQATLDAMPDLLFELDSGGRYIDYHSPRAESLAMPADRFLGRTMKEALPPEAAKVGMAALEEARQKGFSTGALFELTMADGKRWFELSISKKAAAPGQDPTYIALSRDISDRKLAEAELQSRERLLGLFVENSPAAIAMFDRDMRYLVASDRYLEDYGLGKDSLVGRSHYDVFPELTEREKDIHQRCLAGASDRCENDPFIRLNGSVDWVTWEIRPWYEKKDHIGGIIFFSEITTERMHMEAALRSSEEAYRATFDQAAVGIARLDPGGKWLEVNQRCAEALGYTQDELLQLTLRDITHPDDLSVSLDYLDKIQSGVIDDCTIETRYISKSSEAVWVSQTMSALRGYDGSVKYYIAVIEDISLRKHHQAQLQKLSTVVEQSPNPITITDLAANIEYTNEAFSRSTGYSAEEVLGRNPSFLHSGLTPQATYEDMWAHLTQGKSWSGELINRRKDGSVYTELSTMAPVRGDDGQVTHYLSIKENITEKKAAEERIQQLAYFDQLTGLPNHNLLIDRFKASLGVSQRSKEPMAVMILDLDHFKNINNSLGHSIGDLLLIEVAGRLKETIREEDTLSRLGGDEFILILPRTNDTEAGHLAQRLNEVVAKPFVIEGTELGSTLSIGISLFPHDGSDFETLLKNADTAMYRVKRATRNDFCFFTQEMQEHSTRALKLLNALRHALDRDELALHYQPQISLRDGRIIGAEALLRWTNPELGMVSPAEFIPIAEESGLIIPIGEWVLRTAVNQMKRWLDAGLPAMVIAVNLSVLQFRHPNLTSLISQILDESGLLPQYLELELTEAVAMDDPQGAIDVMDRLHGQGVRMSIDDFGTGYSSLSYLKKFMVSKLKIDQSFVRDITNDKDDKAIVVAVINLASSLGMYTIAEGVETAEQLAFLRLQGCNEVQGYYFSRPLPTDQFEAFVRNAKNLVV